MAERLTFPRILYSPTEPSRIFESADEVQAAGGDWFPTPTEAADATARAAAPEDPAPTEAAPEPSHPRSRR